MAESITFKQLRIDTADDLGCYITAPASAASSQTTEADDTITVARLRDYTLDAQRFRAWYVAKDPDLSTFRLIKTTTVPTDGALVLTRGGFTVTDGATLHFFMVMAPDLHGWGLACNNALRDKFLEARFIQSLNEGQTEYNLTATAPWFKSWTQMLRVRERNEQNGFLRPLENEVSVLFRFDDNGQAMLQLPQFYAAAVADKALVISARRYYAPCAVDADVIYTPFPRLIRAEAKCEALYQIFNTMGQGARQSFGQMMVVTERERDEQRARHQNNIIKTDWQTEDERSTGDPLMSGFTQAW